MAATTIVQRRDPYRRARPLYFADRDGVQDCAIYGLAYVRHDPHRRYRAIIMNFEPISRESWQVPPESSIYEVTKI
jgi:hypothetical protein